MNPRGIVCRAVLLALLSLVVTACVPSPPSATGKSGTSGPPTVATALVPTTTALGTSARLLAEAQQFVYRVRTVACLATGTSFATTEGIITNRHVASGSTTLELSTWDGTDFNATVQSISEGPDLALLSNNRSQHVATLATSTVAPGTEVWVTGYPEGDELSVTSGIVLDYVDGSLFGEPGRLIEITDPVQPGNSGSPLLDSEGQVVGVVFAIETATGDGLAIPASTLAQYLASPGSNTSGNCIA